MKRIHLSLEEAALLRRLSHRTHTPIARLELRKRGEESCISTALDNVWLFSTEEDTETLKARGKVLAALAERGLVKIEYDLPVTCKADYEGYVRSKVFARLRALVAEGRGHAGFLFDQAYLMRGRASLCK